MARLRSFASMFAFLLAGILASAAAAADKMHVIIVQSVTVAGADLDALHVGYLDAMYRDLSQTEGQGTVVLQDKQGGNKQRIYEAIDDLKQHVGPRDAVLFYYSGHGAIDQKGHFLALDDRTQIQRNDLRQKLQALGGRLTIIVTDCCAVLATPAPPTAPAPDEDEAMRRRFLGNMKRLLAASGTVDINSSSPGEVAWGNKSGGLFTTQFTKTLMLEEVADWSALTRKVSTNTLASYKEFRTRNINSGGRSDGLGQGELRMLRNQAQQQPHVFVMDLGGMKQPPAIAVNPVGPAPLPQPAVGAGVRVARVTDGTTATNLWLNRTQMKLEVGDRILAINGQAIDSSDQFGEVIDSLERGATFNLLIIDGNSGKKMQMSGKLDVGGRYRFGVTVDDQ